MMILLEVYQVGHVRYQGHLIMAIKPRWVLLLIKEDSMIDKKEYRIE